MVVFYSFLFLLLRSASFYTSRTHFSCFISLPHSSSFIHCTSLVLFFKSVIHWKYFSFMWQFFCPAIFFSLFSYSPLSQFFALSVLPSSFLMVSLLPYFSPTFSSSIFPYFSLSSGMPPFSTLSSSIFSFPSISFIHDPHPQFPSFNFPLVLFLFHISSPTFPLSLSHTHTYLRILLSAPTLVHAHQRDRTHTHVCSPSPACVTDNEWRRRREDNSVNSSR